MNLLLVEDDKNIREMVYEFLTSENYNVITANDGQTAMRPNCKNIPLILSYWI